MKRCKLYFDLDKEEKWLNEMLNKGWELSGKIINYKFSKTSDKDTIIKIDYRIFKKKNDFQSYVTLFQDSGWKHIVGTQNSGKQYFKKLHNTANDDIFSDNESKIYRYKKMSDNFFATSVVFIPITMVLISSNNRIFYKMLNPKLLYFTPGLWEMTGISFWIALIFETPFAFGRGYLWLSGPLFLIIFTIYGFKAKKYYEKMKSEI